MVDCGMESHKRSLTCSKQAEQQWRSSCVKMSTTGSSTVFLSDNFINKTFQQQLDQFGLNHLSQLKNALLADYCKIDIFSNFAKG